MNEPIHHHHHHAKPLPLSLMAQSAMVRVAGALGLIAILWLAIGWAVAKP